MEQEFDGEHLARLVRRSGGGAVRAALIGCGFYRTDPEAVDTIVSCDAAAMLVVRGAAGRERRAALGGGYVLCRDGRLIAAMEAATSEADRARLRDERTVAAFGISAKVEEEDAPVLAAAIEGALRGDRPPAARAQAIALARKYGTSRVTLKFVDAWITALGSPPPGDLVIERVSALRELGEVDQALAAAELVLRPSNRLSRSEQAVLFTQRAALWLDLYSASALPSFSCAPARAPIGAGPLRPPIIAAWSISG